MKVAEQAFSPDDLTQIFAALGDVPCFAIAVSGGGDSMALLRLALRWRGTRKGLIALTVDHHLRDASAAEAEQVSHWCNALSVEHHIINWQHNVVTSAIQAKARTARYDLLCAWCNEHEVPALLTAHTIEDQAETVAMRQRRTSSPRSLAGIWPETKWNGIRILRPLLGETRARLRNHLLTLGQDWLEDPSNTNPAFERVRVRNTGPSPSLADLAIRSQAAITTAQTESQRWITTELVIAATGMMQFAPQAFAALSPLAQDEVLLTLLTSSGGTVPELSRRTTLIAWLVTPQLGRRTLGGVLFAKRQRQILVARESARIDAAPCYLNDPQPILWDRRFRISGPRGSSVTSMSAIKGMKRFRDIPAMVWTGLPVISLENEVLAFPHGPSHQDVKIEFIKK